LFLGYGARQGVFGEGMLSVFNEASFIGTVDVIRNDWLQLINII
jgi:hypothetical protein